jgi:hypothetical protein
MSEPWRLWEVSVPQQNNVIAGTICTGSICEGESFPFRGVRVCVWMEAFDL